MISIPGPRLAPGVMAGPQEGALGTPACLRAPPPLSSSCHPSVYQGQSHSSLRKIRACPCSATALPVASPPASPQPSPFHGSQDLLPNLTPTTAPLARDPPAVWPSSGFARVFAFTVSRPKHSALDLCLAGSLQSFSNIYLPSGLSYHHMDF